VVLWMLSSGDMAGVDGLVESFMSLPLRVMEEDEVDTVLAPSIGLDFYRWDGKSV
jgi:hypothetical protein